MRPSTWTECDERPAGTVVRGVRGHSGERRPWLAAAPVIPALGALGIAHAGVIEAPAPYRIVRTQLGGAYFMATLSGKGWVFLNGKWTACGAGQAVLLMPGVLNAFRSARGRPWIHCWVRIAAGSDVLHGPAERMQVVTRCEGAPLQHALLGLRAAALSGATPPNLQRWAELVLHCVSGFRHSFPADPRITRLWEAVEQDLARPWNMREMARVAALSAEHLRRLSRAATGRSPRAHLVHLRIKRAAGLLLSTDWTLDRIAAEVGYGNAFVFSTTFKRVIGWPPSTYAGRASRPG